MTASSKPMANGHTSSPRINGNGVPHVNGHANGHVNGNGTSTPKNVPPPTNPIAIIGVSCRFAGSATSPSKLWDMCANGEAGWSPIPEDRFDVKSFYHADKERLGRVSAQRAEYSSATRIETASIH